MTTDQLAVADAILVDLATTLAAAIETHNNDDPPDEDTSDEWADLWYDHRRKLDAGYREVCRQRLELVRGFTEHALRRDTGDIELPIGSEDANGR